MLIGVAGCSGPSRPKYLLLQLLHPPVHLLGRLILALIAEHQREDIHAYQRIQMLRGCSGFS